jgi:hypothetical protein
MWRSTPMSFYVFSKPCSTLHNTSWYSTHSLMLYSYCCQNSDISFAVQQICFYVLWFHIHLIALYTVITATGLLFLQYICSSRHNNFCLVIFLYLLPNFPYVETLSWMRKLNMPTPFQNMALDVLPACHTFQTRFYHQELILARIRS